MLNNFIVIVIGGCLGFGYVIVIVFWDVGVNVSFFDLNEEFGV